MHEMSHLDKIVLKRFSLFVQSILLPKTKPPQASRELLSVYSLFQGFFLIQRGYDSSRQENSQDSAVRTRKIEKTSSKLEKIKLSEIVTGRSE